MKVNSDLLQGIFLIILTIIGTTVENTFSCQTLKMLHRNTFAKQIVIICLIYFTIDFTNDKNRHPLETMKSTLFIWVCYIMMSKQTVYFVIALFIILISIYMINNYKEYLMDEKKDNEMVNTLESYEEYLTYILFTIAIIGFILYFIKEKKEHSRNFKYHKFLFGSNKCEHDK